MRCDDEHLSYHGRRSVEELIIARQSASTAAAKAHKELSKLHLERFVTTLDAVAATVATVAHS